MMMLIMMPKWFMQMLLWALAMQIIVVTGFKWSIDDRLGLGEHYEVRSEKYMFSTHDGPLLMGQGSSSITLSLVVDLDSETNSSYSLGMAIFGVQSGFEDNNLADICERSKYALQRTNSWAVDVVTERFPLSYTSKPSMRRPFFGLNSSHFHRTAAISFQYTVKTPARYAVNLMICPDDEELTQPSYHTSPLSLIADTEAPSSVSVRRPPSSSRRSASHRSLLPRETHTAAVTAFIRGKVSFKNPYGFLPAELFGLLPFEASKMIAYVLFALYFLWHFVQNYKSVLMVHKAFLVVLLFAVTEAATWFAAYQMLNATGTPYCCPFPGPIIASMVLQAMRQTLCYSFLLVVCLGYGIVRPRLMRLETVSVLVVGTLYLFAAMLSQVSDIVEGEHHQHQQQQQVGASSRATASSGSRFQMPQLFLDLVFIVWIYLALTSTMRILTEFQQSEKLQLYRTLALIVAMAVILYGAVTFVFVLNKVWDPFLPLAYSWVEPALYEALNAVVFLAMCVLVRPTPTSHLLSYSSQLPMDDPDEREGDEGDEYIDEQTHGTIYSSSDKRRQQQQSLFDHHHSDFDYDNNYDSDNIDGGDADKMKYSEVEMVGSWRRSVPHVNITGYGRGGDYDSLPAAADESSIITDAENNEFDALFKD